MFDGGRKGGEETPDAEPKKGGVVNLKETVERLESEDAATVAKIKASDMLWEYKMRAIQKEWVKRNQAVARAREKEGA